MFCRTGASGDTGCSEGTVGGVGGRQEEEEVRDGEINLVVLHSGSLSYSVF